jgi:ribosome-binding protein aMBF1 (putative translation factor)
MQTPKRENIDPKQYSKFEYRSSGPNFSSVTKTGTTHERERLAALLRTIRTEKGVRQTDLAEKLAEPQSYVSKYESGEQRLDLLEVKAICEALGVTLADFVKRFENKK